MNQGDFAEGKPVRITAGPYEGIEGVIDDLSPECSAVRIYSKEEGSAYALLDQMRVIVKPSLNASKKPLSRR